VAGSTYPELLISNYKPDIQDLQPQQLGLF
jgi:hypothetical protein